MEKLGVPPPVLRGPDRNGTAGFPRFARAWLTLFAALAAAGGACARGARSPEEAQQRLAAAVTARDGSALFDALDTDTRWSYMSIHRAHRESYDIILSTFPDDERERQLRRFEAGATAESARELFAQSLTSQTWTELAGQVAIRTPPQLVGAGDQAEVALPDGRKMTFRKGKDRRGWGYSGMAEGAEQLKRRAAADLETIRASAADYERAATRRGR